MTRRLVLLMLAGMMACSIGENGQEDAGLDVSVLDASGDVVLDVPPPMCADAAPPSCYDAGLARSPALFAIDAGAACPAGYQSYDVVGVTLGSATAFNPSPCKCVCTADAGPARCDQSTASWQSSADNSCGGDSGVITLSGDGGCTPIAFSSGDSHVVIKTPAVLGGCGSGQSVPPATQQYTARLCVPQCKSDPAVCTGVTGLSACTYTSGNVGNCPPGYPKGPYYVGQLPTVGCDQSCTCTESGDCTNAVFHYFTNGACNTGGDQNVQMDDKCHNNWGTFGSARIENPTVNNPICAMTPAGNAQLYYGADAFTVCCP